MNVAQIGVDELNDIVTLILEGLVTDGSHHKQWHLERILLLLVTDEYFNKALKELEWERGIAP